MQKQEPAGKDSPVRAPTGQYEPQGTPGERNLDEPEATISIQGLRSLLDRARRERKPVASRRELARDKTKSFAVLVAVCVVIMVIFFGLFSQPQSRTPLPGESARVAPSLGRKVAPGQEPDGRARSVTPILSADVRQGESRSASRVTPEDIGETSPGYNQSRQLAGMTAATPGRASRAKPKESGEYGLRHIDFSDPAVAQAAAVPNPPRVPGGRSESDLHKPSLVFVRAAQSTMPALDTPPDEDSTLAALLPAGTRLVARLEAPVSSAVPAPVVAVIEYNYERNGEIVLPAGARVLGKLSHVTPAGFVGFQFDRLEMPDGTEEKISATAMDLTFGPLKGRVTGRNRGKNFLVRSLTGIGTVAAYVVGGQGTTGLDGPISENALLRERLANNVGMAGEDEITALTANRNIVVTIPGNTRFYLVFEKGGSGQRGEGRRVRPAGSDGISVGGGKVPTLEELRELLQLRSELNQIYFPARAQQAPAQP